MAFDQMLKHQIYRVLNSIAADNINKLKNEFLSDVVTVHVDCLTTLEYLLNVIIEYIINNCKCIDEKFVYFYQYCELIYYLLNQSESIMNGYEGMESIGNINCNCKSIFEKMIHQVCQKQFVNVENIEEMKVHHWQQRIIEKNNHDDAYSIRTLIMSPKKLNQLYSDAGVCPGDTLSLIGCSGVNQQVTYYSDCI